MLFMHLLLIIAQLQRQDKLAKALKGRMIYNIADSVTG